MTEAALVAKFLLLRFQIDIVAAFELHLSLFMPINNCPNCLNSCHGHASDIRLATTSRILFYADARSTFQPAFFMLNHLENAASATHHESPQPIFYVAIGRFYLRLFLYRSGYTLRDH